MKLNRSSRELLPNLLDEIHDRYFDLDRIIYDKATSEWNLFFGESRKGPFDHLLKITGVTEYVCHDTEKIGIYDINELIIDLDKLLITLDCNVPLDIRLSVNPNFEISTARVAR